MSDVIVIGAGLEPDSFRVSLVIPHAELHQALHRVEKGTKDTDRYHLVHGYVFEQWANREPGWKPRPEHQQICDVLATWMARMPGKQLRTETLDRLIVGVHQSRPAHPADEEPGFWLPRFVFDESTRPVSS
jgi:hypothetical protein